MVPEKWDRLRTKLHALYFCPEYTLLITFDRVTVTSFIGILSTLYEFIDFIQID